MKIFSAEQIRAWDAYSIAHEPVHSIELMERAATACSAFLQDQFPDSPIMVFAGPGNNGGDGLAIARQLKQKGRDIAVFQVGAAVSEDCITNLHRLKPFGIPYQQINHAYELSTPPPSNAVIVDAMLGTGQNRPLDALFKTIVEKVNTWNAIVVSIDLPTGLFADRSTGEHTAIHARYTLSFQVPKLCFFIPENEDFVGEWKILDIGLSKEYYDHTAAQYELTELKEIRSMLKPRKRFSHKGSFGTAMIMAGSMGMMGAAILAARACLRSGAGKLVMRIPSGGLGIMQTSVPEAISSIDSNENFLANLPGNMNQFQAIGIGPGIGQEKFTADMLKNLLAIHNIPMILDADALNIIAVNDLQEMIPPGSLITPHIGEFTRLFGKDENHFDRLARAVELSGRLKIFILIKGRNSFLATPTGKGYFNSTGNSGMAKAGSGDVLTGMVTGMLAQNYDMEQACRIAVFLHGMAGDESKNEQSEYGITASDIIEKIGFCYRKIFNY